MTINDFLSQWHDSRATVPVYTSGSTGKPKLMMAEKVRMEASARMTCKALGLKAGDKALVCLPMDYIAGKMMVVRSLVCDLQMISIEPKGHPMADVADDEEIDFAAMVPMQVYNSIGNEAECRKLMAIKNILIGGGAIDKEMEQKLQKFPNAVWSSYGMTETLSHIALRKINGGGEDSLWYHPLPGVEISLDADNCLVINAPAVCAEVLHTHDIAVVDNAEGNIRFRIVGRIDNVVCSGGVKIQMEEVRRDLAFVINEEVSFDDIQRVIKGAVQQNIFKGSEVFDVYQGENIDKGFKSLAFRIKMQDENATLTDEVIEKQMNNVRTKLQKTYTEISFRE